MIRNVLFSLFLFCFSFNLLAQNGKLLLIGGGSEKSTENAWNKQAYQWAVNNSENKKVAIIAYGDSDNWLPDYFINNCGAATAVNFNIDSPEDADAQSTYDNLIQYDVVFLKGGDQYNYYSTYKNTKTQQAIEEIYNRGGVICGTSAGLAVLSEVVYTAANSSAAPIASLTNPNNSDITLANDFFNFFPGYVFDTHFTIRGRFARTLAFMANWKFNQNENIKAVGVDEMTAMTIDQNNIGTVYGVGCANIYETFYENTFAQSIDKLIADSIKVSQLLQGCSIDFNTGEITGFSSETIPTKKQETGNYTIFASGSDVLSHNQTLINEFVNNEGNASDKTLVITSDNLTDGNAFKSALENAGATDVEVFSAISSNAENTDFKEAINSAKKILFVSNTYSTFINFIKNGSAGTVLYNKIRENDMITAFIGDNARFAGHTVVEKYQTADAAYYGQMTCNEGLDLLKVSAIIPKTFMASDFYENTNIALPFAMVSDNLRYGFWLSGDNFIKYKADKNNEITLVEAKGSLPVIILKNNGTKSGFSVQTAYGDGQDSPPNYAGFEAMTLSLIDETTPYKLGNEITIASSIRNSGKKKEGFFLRKTNDFLIADYEKGNYTVKIFALSGKLISKYALSGKHNLSLNAFESGIYIVRLQNEIGDFYSEKLIITK